MVESKRKVKEALKNKKIDLVLPTKWPFIAPFMEFLKSNSIIKKLSKIEGKNERINIKQELILLIYILKIIIGIPRIRGTEELLTDIGAMSVLGFAPEQVINGICKRGNANQHGNGYKKNKWNNQHIYNY